MGKHVIWSSQADDSFDVIVEYLRTEWSFKEVQQFASNVIDTIKHISTFPQMFPEFHDYHIRKALINPNISMLYKISDD